MALDKDRIDALYAQHDDLYAFCSAIEAEAVRCALAARPAAVAVEPPPVCSVELSMAIGDLCNAMGSPAVMGKAGDLYTPLVRLAAARFRAAPPQDARDAASAVPTPAQGGDAEAMARRFHEIYERLAPSFGYETRPETRQFDPQSPNGRLMVAVCAAMTKEQP